MSIKKNVLCVEDNEDNGEILKVFLEQANFDVTVCASGEECLRRILELEFAAVILDYHLPEKDGIEICREIRKSNSQMPIVFFTADAREIIRRDALEAGADIFLVKPDDLIDIASRISLAIETKNVRD